MKEFVVIGGGIAGSFISYFLRDKDILLLEKNKICSGASGAAGAFLFPKIGFSSKYTDFVNDAILKAISFYEDIGIDVNKDKVLLLPRDEKDISKFEEYKKYIKLLYKFVNGGFLFEGMGVVEPKEVCKKLLENIKYKEFYEVKDIKRIDDYYLINNEVKTKNIILATGWEKVIDIDYLKVRPIWGSRIEIKADLEVNHFYHKNCSVSKKINGIYKIGATHERRWSKKENLEEDIDILINKANEIVNIDDYELVSIKGGMRAGSIDYFPIIGPIIDTQKTIQNNPQILYGREPKEIIYKKNMFIINGGGGRGFSNYYLSALYLRDYILNKTSIPKKLDTYRLFLKFVRKIKS